MLHTTNFPTMLCYIRQIF